MISPSLLSANFLKLGEEIEELEKAGANMLHIDIMDGHFVPNITFGSMIVTQVRSVTKLPLDVHLMISRPEDFVDTFIDAGADILTVHLESTVHLHRLVSYIKGRGVKVGVSINPATPVLLLEDIVKMLDLVLVMTVNPGFGGQSFIPEALEKVKKVRSLLVSKGSKALIEVDGGVNDKNANLLWEAGADILVAGSYIFGSKNYFNAILNINKKC